MNGFRFQVRVYDRKAVAGQSHVETVGFYSLKYAQEYADLQRDPDYHVILDTLGGIED